METNKVANRLVSLCREGQFIEAINELYDETIVSKEMPGYPEELLSGKDVVRKKSEQWAENVEAYHSSEISDPVIAGNHFTCAMKFDITFKDSGRQKIEELCVYEVNNGKITNEHFFYSMS